MTAQIYMLLDMTASMLEGKEATIDACNEFISGQKLSNNQIDTSFTLSVFNSNIGLERIVSDVEIDKAPILEKEHYRPNGATPLYDAICESIHLLDSSDGSVLFIIQTDGEENSSRSHTKFDVLDLIADKTKNGWQFVYLGCDIDAMAEAQDIGISPGNTRAYSRADTEDAFKDLSSATINYRSRGGTSSPAFFENV